MFQMMLTALLCLFGGVTFGAKRPAQPPARPLILVSVYPVQAMVQEIAGEAFDVKPALPYGRSEHDYEASAKDIRTLRSAGLLLIVDQATDGWMVRAAGSKTPVFEILPHVAPGTYTDTLGLAALGGAAAKSMQGQWDPHFWTDPVRMGKAAMAVAQHLGGMLAPGSQGGSQGGTEAEKTAGTAITAIMQRAKTFAARMTGLNAAIIGDGKSWPRASVILAHGSLGYYGRITGLKIIGILEPVPHVEPTPRHLAELIQLAKANKPCVVLAEEQIDDAVARALGREASVTVARINPLGYPNGYPKASNAGAGKDNQVIGAYDRYLAGLTQEVAKGFAKELSGK